jgi:hypothetical protein
MTPLIRLEAWDQGVPWARRPYASCVGLLPTIVQLDVGTCRTAPHRPLRRVDHPDPGEVADVRQLSRPHGTAYNDFERLDRSRYRLRPHRATESDYQDEWLDHGA